MANMFELIEELWFLKRDILSDDYDRALARLAEELPMTIHEVPSGANVWTWTVPEKWTCRAATLESLDGKRLIDYAEHPLHVVSYSLPFEGEVSREELLPHLHAHVHLPDAIPFVFKYHQRDWGLCASQQLIDSLTEERYRVHIDTVFEPGTLKIGEVFIPGEVEDCFVLAAHLDHPAMANDDLTGVVVGLDVARRLLAGPTPHFSYRLLIFPETLGSIAYLSQHEELIPKMLGGLFLEMLGNAAPHALQSSFQPDSQTDRSLLTALHGLEPGAYVGPYRSIIDNDERQFNAPGVRVPMLSLSRVVDPHLPASRFYPYPEYHSSFDTPEIVSLERLEASRDLVLELLRAFDNNRYLLNRFKGEVFASGHGIWVDYRVNPEGHKRLFEIMERCDGTRTPADIAVELDLSFQTVWDIIAQLIEKELVALINTPQSTDPHLPPRS
jgi:aminopeptidase-like protein